MTTWKIITQFCLLLSKTCIGKLSSVKKKSQETSFKLDGPEGKSLDRLLYNMHTKLRSSFSDKYSQESC